MKGSETGTCLPFSESSRKDGMAEEAGSNRGWNGPPRALVLKMGSTDQQQSISWGLFRHAHSQP